MKQIQQGPVTVTEPRIKQAIMPLPSAVQQNFTTHAEQ